MQSSWWRVLVVIVVVAVVAFLATGDAEAQCSMCRAALTKATNTRFVRNLNIGVLVLMIPPVTIFCSIFILLKRHRGQS